MHLLKDILTYSYRGSGKYVMISCVVLSIVADLVAFAPLFGGIAGFILSGYFCAIYFQLVQSTAIGGKEAPDFPDTSNLFGDVIWPMLQVFVVALVSFAPLIGYALWAEGENFSEWIAFGLMGAGVVYFPMALLAVVVLGYTGALSPHIVLPAIFRGGWLYWFGVFMLGLLFIGETMIGDALSGLFVVGPVIMAVISSYTLMTNARIMGVVYRERQEELGWL